MLQQVYTMRGALLLAMSCLSGCVLYLGEEEPPSEPPPDDEPPIFEPMSCPAAMWCDSGVVMRTPPVVSMTAIESCPDPALREAIRACEYGCAPDALLEGCGDQPCDPALAEMFCYQPPAPARCTQEGQACATEGITQGCPAQSLCGTTVPVGECTCTGGLWACEESCDNGLCGPDAVAAALVGTWRGTVDPPPFSEPYEVTLEFRADGTYVATCGENCDLVFYYGSNGTSPSHRYRVIGQTSVGALLAIGIVFQPADFQEGQLDGLRIDGDRLTFTFWDAWGDGCARPFLFDLSRI